VLLIALLQFAVTCAEERICVRGRYTRAFKDFVACANQLAASGRVSIRLTDIRASMGMPISPISGIRAVPCGPQSPWDKGEESAESCPVRLYVDCL